MKFHSNPVEEQAEVPAADLGELESHIARWTGRASRSDEAERGERSGYVLSVVRPGDELAGPARLAEITGLVRAQGDRVAGKQSYRLVRPDARTLIGRGAAERIGAQAQERGADMLVVDAELSPSQTRNLENATGLPICDREAVILNVFARNASTRCARMQVEIAHLEYLRPRIRGIGLNMDQQAGGVLGGRGPGETASELLVRRLDERLVRLRRALIRLRRSGAEQRRQRQRCERVVLVGYTNAGKTSLMNALTCAGLSVRDRPFETLDATSRALARHGGDVLLSDTVGFIRRLPERLLASFASTLAEVTEASLLLVVLDVSDPELALHLETTEAMLAQLGAERTPRLVVFNKLDRLAGSADRSALAALARGAPHVALCARDPQSVAALRARILEAVRRRHVVREVFVPYASGEVLRAIYARTRVRSSTATPRGTQLRIEGEPQVIRAIAAALRRSRG